MSMDWDWLAAYNQGNYGPNVVPLTTAQAQQQQAQSQNAVAQFLAGTQGNANQGNQGNQGRQPPPGPNPNQQARQQAQAQQAQANAANAQLRYQQNLTNAQLRRQARQQRAMERGIAVFRGARSRMRNMPTPGGIGALVLVLLVLLMFIVPVNGKNTRAQLIFDVARGADKLPDEGDVGSVPPGDTSGVGNNTGTGSGPVVTNPATPDGAVVTNQVNPFTDFSPSGVPMPGIGM